MCLEHADQAICVDNDECATRPDACPLANSRCVNYEGFYNCRCERGYEGGECSDVDECLQPHLTVCDPARHKVYYQLVQYVLCSLDSKGVIN